MPAYGVDSTMRLDGLTAEQRDQLERSLADNLRAGYHVERWTLDGVDYLRAVHDIEAPTLTDAIVRLGVMFERWRRYLGLRPGLQVGISIALRDLREPIERTLPPTLGVVTALMLA